MKPRRKSGPRSFQSNASSPHPRGLSHSAAEIPRNTRPVAGLHATRELLKIRPGAVAELWIKAGSEGQLDDLIELAKRRRITLKTQSPAVLDKIVAVHQGVVAFATEAPELSFADLKRRERSTLVVLDEVEDPHNLGAVMRTSWLLGVDGILTPEARTTSPTATVAKVAQGAAEHVPVMRDTGLVESIKYLKEQGYWVYGLAAGGTKTLYDVEIPEKIIWVLGSESSGIRKPVANVCDEMVGIPQIDADASYNVSVAAALALGETFRQRAFNPS